MGTQVLSQNGKIGADDALNTNSKKMIYLLFACFVCFVLFACFAWLLACPFSITALREGMSVRS